VILLEERDRPGGSLLHEGGEVEGLPARAWLDGTVAELASAPGVRIFTRTGAFGLYDHGMLAAVERVADHLPEPPPGLPRQRLLKIRARAVVLATGSTERPIVCGDNDLPGVMLASAAHAYLGRFAVAAGRRPVIFTNNDSAYAVALAFAAAGVTPLVVDARLDPDPEAVSALRRAGGECLAGRVVTRARGFHAVRAVEVRATAGGRTGRIACDTLLLAGGFSPNLQLWMQRGGRPEWDEAAQSWRPRAAVAGVHPVGAAAGFGRRAEAVTQARAVARRLAQDLGLDPPRVAVAMPEASHDRPMPLFAVEGGGKRFVDLQNDVTAEDIALAVREGMAHPEHLKRWTTLGMGVDQGRSAAAVAAALLAAETGVPVPNIAAPSARPPATPVAIGALAGEARGGLASPLRRTPLDPVHEALGAEFLELAHWRRPRWYRRAGESGGEAYVREAAQVRRTVGVTDVSTLGKIEVLGPDAAALLEHLYVNRIASLPEGRARYGVMLREDGFVFDDGTVSRLGPSRFFVTTSTAHAEAVLRHMEYYAQVIWPELRVHIADVGERWAAMAVAGPRARELLEAAFGLDAGPAALPFMAARELVLEGLEVRLLRVSFSGEWACELYVPADQGAAVFEHLLAVGRRFDAVAYGLEAMGTLRIEKGHPAGPEIDGRTTLADLGLARLAADKPFVGRPMMRRDGLADPARPCLVALVSTTGRPIRAGALLFAEDRFRPHLAKLGHVTSTTFSPALDAEIALALLARGRERYGTTVYASSPLHGEHLPVEVRPPCLFDPKGKRLRDGSA
jgi:sarcosine oxidase subunit alpha